MTMICDRCGTATITWRGPLSALTHTECSSCGGMNCQRVEDIYDADYDDGECWNCGGEGYVFDCIDGFCADAEAGCDLCTRRCDVCNPTTTSTGTAA
ncbi:hypothetical protein V5G24_20115 [Xanthobacter sp. VTT E-85241]|uniref:hypothetical protein n=1 Tax=Roseixanthobacter finlandensis TaxID=3119922 RepID=UPI0037298E96